MKIRDVMTRNVVTVDANATLADAAHAMWDHDCGIVPVVKNETLMGVITDRDICMGGMTQRRPLTEIPVVVSMTRAPKACHADDDLSVAHQLMREFQVRRIPVIDDDHHVEGIISLDDLAVVAKTAKPHERERHETEIARSLEAICSPPRRASHAVAPPRETSEGL